MIDSRSKSLVVTTEDLQKIGHTSFGTDDGFLAILCSGDTCNIEGILLREILSLTGHTITNEDDFIWESGQCDWKYTTSIPWTEYMERESISCLT
jgi:hypothetical protein